MTGLEIKFECLRLANGNTKKAEEMLVWLYTRIKMPTVQVPEEILPEQETEA